MFAIVFLHLYMFMYVRGGVINRSESSTEDLFKDLFSHPHMLNHSRDKVILDAKPEGPDEVDWHRELPTDLLESIFNPTPSKEPDDAKQHRAKPIHIVHTRRHTDSKGEKHRRDDHNILPYIVFPDNPVTTKTSNERGSSEEETSTSTVNITNFSTDDRFLPQSVLVKLYNKGLEPTYPKTRSVDPPNFVGKELNVRIELETASHTIETKEPHHIETNENPREPDSEDIPDSLVGDKLDETRRLPSHKFDRNHEEPPEMEPDVFNSHGNSGPHDGEDFKIKPDNIKKHHNSGSHHSEDVEPLVHNIDINNSKTKPDVDYKDDLKKSEEENDKSDRKVLIATVSKPNNSNESSSSINNTYSSIIVMTSMLLNMFMNK